MSPGASMAPWPHTRSSVFPWQDSRSELTDRDPPSSRSRKRVTPSRSALPPGEAHRLMSSPCSRCRRSSPAGAAVPPASSTSRAPRLRGLERGKSAAMEQAGIVEAGHDGHERIKSRALFRHPSVARRAERRQADADRMREGRLGLAAWRRPRQISSGARSPWLSGQGANRSGNRASAGRRGRKAGRISVRAALGGNGDQQPERPRWRRGVHCCRRSPPSFRRSMSRPIRPTCSRSRNDSPSTCRRSCDGREAVLQGVGGTSQPGQIEIVMCPFTSSVHERRFSASAPLPRRARKLPKLIAQPPTDRSPRPPQPDREATPQRKL